MKTRFIALAVAIVAFIIALFVWRGHGASTSSTSHAPASGSAGAVAVTKAATRVDPRTQPRGSIAGTITAEDTHAPVAGARVCARSRSTAISKQVARDAICTAADGTGHYVLKDLLAAEYEVAAASKPYRPGAYRAAGERDISWLLLAAGEAKAGVDIALRAGGVEITGTVQDVSGGPIAHAIVTAGHGWDRELIPSVETDDAGTFSMYVAPGRVDVTAVADGYATGIDHGQAPGSFSILLTPESSIAGTVVDAISGAPVPGVWVSAEESEWGWFGSDDSTDSDITDEQGAFRITRLEPGRFNLRAHSTHGFGASSGSTLVGLGQQVDGIVIKLHAGFHIAGKVVLPDNSVCPKPSLTLIAPATGNYIQATVEPDHTLHAEGVLPRTYKVDVSCEGYLAHDHYDDIKIVDKDVTDLTWHVDTGATIRGRVLTKSGAPVEEANIWARTTGGAARSKTGYGDGESDRNGNYALDGLKAGSFKLEVQSARGLAPKDGWAVDVAAGAKVDKDLILDDGGQVTGTVVDSEGKPVAGVGVHSEPIDGGSWSWGSNVRTGADGTFTMDNLRPGTYRITASRGRWSDDLRKPGSTDDDKQGEKAVVAVGKPASVRLVVESPTGTIKGSIVDAAGAPISDAYVAAARESDAAGARSSSVGATRWSFDDHPVLSNTDGTFTISRLTPGKYTVRAYRKGGGEAIEEHVAVGSTTTLTIRATGSIAGTVKQPSDKPIERLTIELVDEKSGYRRSESFFRTSGAFTLDELPAGHFTLTATTEGGKAQLVVDLAEGEHKTGVNVTLEELVTLIGRIVDMQTKAPVPGIRVLASLAHARTTISFSSSDDDQANISDTDGTFKLENQPRGKLTIRGLPKDWGDSDYAWLSVARDVTGSGTVDLGDLPILKKRIKEGEPVGELGVHFADQPPGIEDAQREWKVSYIDPKGPAAKVDIKVGDVVTTIDGIEAGGTNLANGRTLMAAPPGTPLKLGLARGTTVTIVLAAP